MPDGPYIISQHYALSLDHKEVGVRYAGGHVDEIQAGGGERKEEDEGEDGAIGHPQQPPQ